MENIKLYRHSVKNRVDARTSHDFFKDCEDVIIAEDHEKVTFRRPDLDYTGMSHRVKIQSKGVRGVAWQSQITDLGAYEFDEEESNEDVMVFYFK